MSGTPEFGDTSRAFPPIISDVTLEALRSQFEDNMEGDNQTWGERLTETQEKLVTKNPNLVDFIEQLASQHPPEMHQAIFETVVGVLVLLERQAMSDLE